MIIIASNSISIFLYLITINTKNIDFINSDVSVY